MQENNEILEFLTNPVTKDAGNIISINESNDELQYSQTYNVQLPKPSDKIVFDISSINKIKETCKDAKKVKQSYSEWLLGLSTLLLGGFFSALLSQVTYEFEALSIFFYTICPVCGVGAGVAYWFCQKSNSRDITYFAAKIEAYIQSDEIEGGKLK